MGKHGKRRGSKPHLLTANDVAAVDEAEVCFVLLWLSGLPILAAHAKTERCSIVLCRPRQG
jgi:hypothetical protein